MANLQYENELRIDELRQRRIHLSLIFKCIWKKSFFLTNETNDEADLSKTICIFGLSIRLSTTNSLPDSFSFKGAKCNAHLNIRMSLRHQCIRIKSPCGTTLASHNIVFLRRYGRNGFLKHDRTKIEIEIKKLTKIGLNELWKRFLRLVPKIYFLG